MEEWPHSSYQDYLGSRKSICNKALVTELLALDPSRFYEDSYKVINFNTGDFD